MLLENLEKYVDKPEIKRLSMWQLKTQIFVSTYLTGVHFRGELQRICYVSEQKSGLNKSELEK